MTYHPLYTACTSDGEVEARVYNDGGLWVIRVQAQMDDGWRILERITMPRRAMFDDAVTKADALVHGEE